MRFDDKLYSHGNSFYNILFPVGCFFVKNHNILCFSLDRPTNYVIMGSTKQYHSV